MRRTWTCLQRRADFLRIAATRLRRVTPAFIVQAAQLDAPGPTQRIGFTVSRKVGNSVARSRAKRRLRAIADQVLGAPTAFEYVLVGRADALRRDFAVMTADLRSALDKLAKSPRRSA